MGDAWIQKETEMCAQGKGITRSPIMTSRRGNHLCFLNPLSEREPPLFIPPSGIEMYISS